MSDNHNMDRYKYLPSLLHHIRWAQRFAAILAEALILIAFLASGMDVSMGGILANISAVKWAWAAIFSLGVDTSFVVSWVRCRELGRSWHLLWSIPVALCISFVVFEPVVIQLLQQALDIEFSEALRQLGINITVLVYARAGVAVFLGAILAVTNVESGVAQPAKAVRPPKQRFWLFELFQRECARISCRERQQAGLPKLGDETPAELPAPIEQPTTGKEVPPADDGESNEQVADHLVVPLAQLGTSEDAPLTGAEAISDEPTEPVSESTQRAEDSNHINAPLLPLGEQPVIEETPVVSTDTTPAERESKVRELDLAGLTTAERVAAVTALFPSIPDRELGRLSGVSAATAKKYRPKVSSDATYS